MRLVEHPDFEQAVLHGAEFFRAQRLRPAIIEKDYYVTEALRALTISTVATGTRTLATGAENSADITTTMANKRIIFKGGTNRSKGWNVIHRFTEDIDIILESLAFDPTVGKQTIDRELKSLRDAVAGHPGLSCVAGESQTIGGFGRNDRFAYTQQFGRPGEVANLGATRARANGERGDQLLHGSVFGEPRDHPPHRR